MKKLFSGRIGRIPMAVLAISLLAVIAAGGVVAATTGYVLWEGTSEITVDEAITIYYGPDAEHCDTELDIEDPLGAYVALMPGECQDTWFKLISVSTSELLIKAAVTSSSEDDVTVVFDSADITTTGLVIDDSLPVFVHRTVCVSGDATTGTYVVSTTFTRESPPVP